ncbi:MAG: DNA-processing protein DprA [Candidatus Amulumruptor caecigallinarius]|nr:DNA-processing protein DprA [Candidatus Amulumruptor caecigallinarius]MCM1397711.1 DNA-processing protein DprA [Candidatus Amulumruptor caecigallinarius]
MIDTELRRQIAFSSLPGINASTGRSVLDRTGSLESFFSLGEKQLQSMLGTRSRMASRQVRDVALTAADRELAFIMGNGVNTSFITEGSYPRRLTECDDAPALFYSLGDCDLDSRFVLGIVGTRHATPYGCDFIRRVVSDLAANLPAKPVIVSGLAYGVDIAAHRAAMDAGCPTVAVLAHGLKTIYPSVHRTEARRLLSLGGALVTEYRSDAPVHKGNFLARNRIVAGLSDGVIVVESAERGGALVTARLAAAYNREVMALPGRISDEYSKGCNLLIRRHQASMVTCADDVAELLGWPLMQPEGTQNTLPLELTPDEQAIVELLRTKGEATVDAIAAGTTLGISRTMALLVDMEFKGILICYPGARYRLA